VERRKSSMDGLTTAPARMTIAFLRFGRLFRNGERSAEGVRLIAGRNRVRLCLLRGLGITVRAKVVGSFLISQSRPRVQIFLVVLLAAHVMQKRFDDDIVHKKDFPDSYRCGVRHYLHILAGKRCFVARHLGACRCNFLTQ
jgi:hypothetical protein